MGRKILFRVDAGRATGLGHFYRSLTLAKALFDKGHSVRFVHRPSPFWDSEILAGFPFESHSLEMPEEKNMLVILKKMNSEIFYADGIIGFSERFIAEVREFSKVIFFQNTDPSRILADVFIWPSLYESETFFNGFPTSTRIFKGLEYFIFHNQISRLKPKNTEDGSRSRSVAIISGGTDPKNVLFSLFGMIDYDRFHDVQFNFFVGKDFMHRELIPTNPPGNVIFPVFDHGFILRSDLLISVFGVSTYEFLALGMPVISVAHQESNSRSAEALCRATQAVCHLGLIDDLQPDRLNQVLDRYIGDGQARILMAENARKTIDLKGVERVTKIIEDV